MRFFVQSPRLAAVLVAAALMLSGLPAAGSTAQERLQALVAEREAREAQERAEAEAAAARRVRPEILSILDDPDTRGLVIERHRPARAGDGLLPADLVRHVSLRWGAVLEWFSLYEEARAAYTRAVALGQNDPETWRRLAWTRTRCGDFAGAEGALLAAAELVTQDGVRAREFAAVHRDLGRLYIAMKRPWEASEALERSLEQEPGSTRSLELLARAQHERAPHFIPAPPQPVLLWTESDADQRRARWEGTLASLYERLPPVVQSWGRGVAVQATDPEQRWALAAALGACFLLWVGARRFKGKGDVAVTLSYPAELVGTFSVRLAAAPGKHKRQTRNAKIAAAQAPAPASTRTERFGVSRETQFQGLHTGFYYVTVEGILHDPEADEIVSDPFDEQAVEVVRKRTVNLEFEVAPRESVVEVRVFWDKRPAKNASVAARGMPQSLRYARDGTTRLPLPKGRHVVMVGGGDRVAEREIEVESIRAEVVEVDLSSSESLIFKGCPPAVEPYLHGDLGSAARALERDGHSRLANLLLARLHEEQGRRERAAEHYELAEHWSEAAELRAGLRDWDAAATLFEKAQQPGRAGQMRRQGGELLAAGALFEAAGDFDAAIDCYRDAQNHGKWIDALERKGETFEAATLAVEQRDQSRSIRLLQQIQPEHPNHAEACEMLAAAYLQEGHRDLAAQKLEERIATCGEGPVPPDLRSQLAQLLEEDGDYDKALDVLSDLREQEPTYPSIATRIEELRKKRSGRDLGDSRGAAHSAPTAFLATSRYEIQAEIGRGGMGVVLKARDTRLERVVALKRLPETLRDHPKAIQLFLREAQAAARLNHPNITTVYDTDQEDGNFFITMELLEGAPISKIVKQRGRISPRNTAQLGVQIAAGLEYAHGKGIVHRDIKSANLFFTVDKVVKIMDFGLAKMIEEVRRGTTVIGGTPYYMAPEQAAGETVDARADIYALGVTFYEFLTGRVPFLDGDVAYQHRHAPVPDPRALVEDLPDALALLILEMLEKDPEERVATAAEVGERLGPLTR